MNRHWLKKLNNDEIAKKIAKLILLQKPFELSEGWEAIESELKTNPKILLGFKTNIILNALWFGVKENPKETASLLFSLLI